MEQSPKEKPSERVRTEERQAEKRQAEEMQREKRQTEEMQREKRQTEEMQREERQTEKMQTEKMQTEERQTEKRQTEQMQAEKAQLEKALRVLENFVHALASEAGKSSEEGDGIWQRVRNSGGLLRELAYYHDYGNFLCEYKVAGYTLADILVWQVDHFKLYMDRPEEMNRYRQARLFLDALDTMAQMEENPRPFQEKMRCETGQDIL